jgi:hypothetical protein
MERRWAAGALFTESEQEETHNVKDSIKKDPTKFQEIIDAREPEVKAAMQELSVKLDVIFSTAIKPSKIGCGGVTDAEAR